MFNCRGHFRSMEVGGQGHYPFDHCGCEVPSSNNIPQTPISSKVGVGILILIATFLAYKKYYEKVLP